ncbi:MAG: tetratricopeptide repeat protein [Candidatus Obscuribacterales bacterium]|nr:tetratricopeptide repeat protein [Candidatus Obscuribacterales bacterium]
MDTILTIVIALAGLIALAAIGRWYNRRVATERWRREQSLRHNMADKPPVAPQKTTPKAVGPAKKESATDDGIKVNGAWLHQMNNTTEPKPNFGTRTSLRQSLERAKTAMAACSAARKRQDKEEAEKQCELALTEVQNELRRDHWYTAEVLNMLACLRYDHGFYTEARDVWEEAEQICEEWPTKHTDEVLKTIRNNLKQVRGTLGF